MSTAPASLSDSDREATRRCRVLHCWVNATVYEAFAREAARQNVHVDALAARVLTNALVRK